MVSSRSRQHVLFTFSLLVGMSFGSVVAAEEAEAQVDSAEGPAADPAAPVAEEEGEAEDADAPWDVGAPPDAEVAEPAMDEPGAEPPPPVQDEDIPSESAVGPEAGANASEATLTPDVEQMSRTVSVRHDAIRRPRPWHIRASGSMTGMFVHHESFDVVSSDDLLTSGCATLEGEWVFLESVPVAVQVGYMGADLRGTLFSDLETETTLRSLQVGALVGYRFWDAITLFVRGGFIAAWARATIAGLDQTLGDWDFAPGAYVMAGFEVQLLRRWMQALFHRDIVTIGIRFEAGWVHAGSFDTAEATTTSGLIENREADLGTLTLRGAAINVGGFLSF